MHLKTLQADYERWLNTTQDLSPHTVLAYTTDVTAFHQFLRPRHDISTLSTADLYKFLEHLQTLGNSPTTIKRRLCGVRSYCGWLTATNHIETNPGSNLTIRFARPRRLPRAVSESDLRRLLRHLSNEAELGSGPEGQVTGLARNSQTTTLLAVLLMLGTGIRVGELTQTRLSDVDLPSRTIRVVGKGLRERLVYLSNDSIIRLISHYIDQCRPLAGSSTTLLVNRSGGSMTPSAVRTRFERAGLAAGMTTRLTPHMLRHTAATQLIEAGVDIRFVQRLLGHASLTTTEIYTHVADRSLRRAVTAADVLGSFMTYG